MLTTSQKFRLLIYIILLPVMLFLFPVINQMLVEGENQGPPVERKAIMPEVVNVLSATGVVLYGDEGSNIWSHIEKSSQVRMGSKLATHGEKSRLMVRTPEGVALALGGSSRLTVSRSQEHGLLVSLNYGCFGLRVEGPVSKEVGVVFLSGTKKMKMSGEKVYCRVDEYQELEESTLDLFMERDTNLSDTPSLKNIYPCREVIEVDDPSGSSTSPVLRFSAPPMVSKLVNVSTNEDFTDNVFSAKTYSREIRVPPLGRGRFFWRIKNESTSEYSQACSFEVVHHGDITQKLPKNGEVFVDRSIEMSWDSINGAQRSVVVITKDLSSRVHSVELTSNSTKIDDPVQVLGPGSYYWRVEAGGRVSPYRRFFVYTANDLVVNSPKIDDVLRPSEKFFMIEWEPLPMARSYSVIISSSPSFVSSEYANTTEYPFVFIEPMKDGRYYIKVSALFDEGKVSTESIPFSIHDVPDVDILYPIQGNTMDVSRDRKVRVRWMEVKGVSGYSVLVNDETPVNTGPDRTEAEAMVSLGGNRVRIEAYCGTANQRALCAKSKVVEFFVNNIIDSPLPPVIKYPYNRKIFPEGMISMEWSASRGASGYKVEISRKQDFSEVQENETLDTKLTVTMEKGIYYWRVYSYTDRTGSRLYSKPTEKRLFLVR